MTTVLDYLVWRGDLTFSRDPFNEVDNLILCELAYFDFHEVIAPRENVTLFTAAKRYFKRYPRGSRQLGLLLTPAFDDLLALAAQSKRFGSLRLCRPVNIVKKHPAMQFSATTFLLPTKEAYVAFRGTDDHIVAWKESLSLAIQNEIPAQKAALSYVKAILAFHRGDLYIGGHSKGGNLAMYAFLHLEKEEREKVKRVYNNDGPGFRHDVSHLEAFDELLCRMTAITPYLSVVGAMLEHGDHAEVIESYGKGLLQHDAFTWRVRGCHFVRLPKRSKESYDLEATVKTWTEKLGEKEQKRFLETLYRLLTASGAETLTQLSDDKIRTAYKSAAALFTLSKETRDLVAHALLLFFRERRAALRAPQEKK